MDALEKKYSVELINERIEALKKFKQEVSAFSLTYAKLEFEEQPKLKSVPVFMKGLNFYNELNLQIIQELEAEIKRTQLEMEGIQSLKEAQLNKIAELLSMTTYSMIQSVKLEQAVETIKQLPVFGINTWEQDFKWPKAADILKIPANGPIQVIKLRWKKNSKDK